MGFENLPQAIDVGQALAPITAEKVRPAAEGWDDATALGIVLQDTADTIAYLQSKGLVPLGIEAADDLVRGFVKARAWPDGKARANLSFHVVLQAIEKIIPSLYMSLFATGKKRPFLVTSIGKTSPEAARANSSLLWWAMKQSKLKEEMRLMMKTSLTYGFCVGCWGWESKEIRKKKYAKDADGKMKGTVSTFPLEIPAFECLDLKMVLVDPGLKRQDVQHAKFVVKQFMVDSYDLDDLRSNPAYKNIPTDEELAMFLANKAEPTEDSLTSQKRMLWREFQAKIESEQTSKDPFSQPLEILEYTSEERVVTVLQRKLVIRNEMNEFARLNYQSCAFVDVLGSAWGFGVARLLSGEQKLQTGVGNNWIDSLALVLNPVFQLLKGIGPGTQSIPMSPGRVITESGELKPLVVPDITKPALEAIAASDVRASEKVGSNSGSGMPNQAMRTAEGVQAFSGDVIQRLQYWLEQFINLVYIPTLQAYLEIMHDHLTPEQVNEILTAEEGQGYTGDMTDVYNADPRTDLKVDVLAGASMMARFAAAQLAPMLIQMVTAGPVSDQFETAGVKFNFVEFARETTDMLGWNVENLIVNMTPEDLQRVKEKNQALSRSMGDQQLQAQKHQDDLADIDAKASGQAGVATVRSILKHHEEAASNAMEQMQTNQAPEAPTNG